MSKKDVKELTVLARLQKARSELMKVQKNKSGNNKFAGFSYMELKDFLPELTEICEKEGIAEVINLRREEERAVITIFNVDNLADYVEFEVPMIEANVSKQQPIQNSGATITYYRRYLYQLAFNIVERDIVDSTETSEMLAEQTKNSNKRTTRTATAPQQENPQNKQALIENITKNIPEANIQGFLSSKGVDSLEKVSEGELQAAWNAYSQNMQN